MSIFAPISSAARRTFRPRLPMASESWSLSTMTSRCGRCACSSLVTRDARDLGRRERVLREDDDVFVAQGMMSIFSPRSSRMMDCTREPFMPTQAPTGSTSRSRDVTAILARSPGSRTAPLITTVPS